MLYTRIRERSKAIMFTGIIEHLGTIETLDLKRDGGRVTIHAPSLAPSLAVSNSIAVNGCCLTIVDLHNGRLCADLSGETLSKTSFGSESAGLKHGARVNLEQPLTAEGDNWWYGVKVPEEFARYIVPKGSITIDGISLTVARWKNNIVEVAVIPYTYEHTNIRDRKPGDAVNLEGDILGKYVERYLEAQRSSSLSKISMSGLVEQGF